MKKRNVNLKQLVLNKSNVASLKPERLTGGFQSWTGTAEPCFPTDFDCNPIDGSIYCITGIGCVPPTVLGCPSDHCTATVIGCNSDSMCPQGVYCY
ncbi:hypothetical protein [Kordia jejudonensis]|uniref:hypothetical protein n=1 Tax=Kordia jejudonensis TaxID=1348245 RepID=UPI0006291E84|nr:hypothetical protein [Kordia jejudonensis]